MPTPDEGNGPVNEARDLDAWLAEVSGPEWVLYCKVLSSNDTYAKPNVHQGGPYLGRDILTVAFPLLTDRADREVNPDVHLPASVDSHGWSGDVRLVWYNSKRLTGRANGRDEARLTRWGGSSHPLVEPDATGAIAAFAFLLAPVGDADAVRVWRSRGPDDTALLIERFGEPDPGHPAIVSAGGSVHPEEPHGSCTLEDNQIPAPWREAFPTGDEIIQWVVSRLRDRNVGADRRLVRRRDCEYDVFRSVERWHVLPRVRRGFDTVDAFVEYAGSVSNRRKSRAGRSLELHVRQILREESIPHSWQPRTELSRRPDFIFPSIERYRQVTGPDESLRMLAVKTTCKDRWRQILNEAARVPIKHLLTLQRGVSVDQFREMADENVVLVVPKPLMRSYPRAVRGRLVSLEMFLKDVRKLGGPPNGWE